MGSNRKLVNFAGKLLPSLHGRYEQMCSLAAAGQLGGPEMSELNQHIATCVSCRRFLESIAEVSLQVMPLLADGRVVAADVAPHQDMRARFLSRLASEVSTEEYATPIPFPIQAQKAPSDSVAMRQRAPKGGAQFIQGWFLFLCRSAAILAVCAILAIAGYYAGHRNSLSTESAAKLSAPKVPPLQHPLPPDKADTNRQLEQEKASLETQLRSLKEKLSAAETTQHEVGNRLADADKKLAALSLEQSNAQAASIQQNQRANIQIATLQSEVERLRMQSENSATKLAAEQSENLDLSARLGMTEVSLQREHDLESAKREMGDLIAARNLHIVDVYDAAPNGKRQRSFGRVFYVEGKSLVFYAYDLDSPKHFRNNIVFRVWGGKSGVQEVTLRLGVLHKDNSDQGRWAMTFDDPKVLSQINSVFVTEEAASKNYDGPHGKRVLYAYLGSPPNHP